jgi:ATP-dependent Clp protease protease subunit
LAGGAKGKRYALPNSKVMIHQLSGGFQGPAADIEIQAKEALNLRKKLDEILSRHTGKPLKKVSEDTDRDYFMTAKEAKDYGIIDKIIEERKQEK